MNRLVSFLRNPYTAGSVIGGVIGGAGGAISGGSGSNQNQPTGEQRRNILLRHILAGTVAGAASGAAGSAAGIALARRNHALKTALLYGAQEQIGSTVTVKSKLGRAKLGNPLKEVRDRPLSKNDHQMSVDALQKSKGDAFEAISKRHEDLRNKINDLETRFWPTASTYGARGQTVPTEAATSALSRAQTDDLFKEMEDDLASLSHGLLGKKALLNSLKGAIYKTASLSRPAPQP